MQKKSASDKPSFVLRQDGLNELSKRYLLLQLQSSTSGGHFSFFCYACYYSPLTAKKQWFSDFFLKIYWETAVFVFINVFCIMDKPS